ncbi:MAG: carboxypeptidase-like regulatory domain-containing protein [Elusimicrobiota bacterium]|nr:carboxypeptidase-like regulatory domain-containing protein [Elusimicrobiota bacterium]MDH5661701.1 carboxypeptidase-like regulatory domain-containing protein [Elusimicrobiota bacterium]
MKKWIILGMVFLVAGLLISGCAKAPEGTGVYGKVIDKETKNPVEGVTITITALKQVTEASPAVWAVTATTDNSGNYSLPELEPGNYTVTVTSPGYLAYSRGELGVKQGKMKKLDIRLEASFLGG